jgi:DNA polymerase/3'-5' exonuclease PolX
MEYAKAKVVADEVVAMLAPHCARIEIAGSIRRRKADCGDVEVVAIPRVVSAGLFGDIAERAPGWAAAVDSMERVKGDAVDGKYMQRVHGASGMKVDIFTAAAENWGLALAVRTGSALFSHYRLAAEWVKRGYRSNEGMLWQGARMVPVREERDLFELLGLGWVHPEDRSW